MARALYETVLETSAGVPESLGQVTLTNTDGSALTGALYAAESGGSPLGLTTLTADARGLVQVYRDTAGRMKATHNGVTTPQAFWPDPGDLFAMGPDGVTVTQAYRAIARMRVAALESKVRDMGGFVANVDAFADGVTVNNYTASGTGGDCSAAVIAAVAYLNGVGGGILEFGIGSYRYPSTTTWGNNIQTRGTRGKTELIHPPGNSATIVNALNGTTGYVNFGFTGITFNGNYENNLDFDAGSCEVAFRGTDTYLYDCTVKNFNAFGVQFGGTRPVIANCRILGPNDGAGIPYANYADLAVSPNRYAGRDGLFTAVACENPLVYGNYVSGLRLPGMFIGGSGLIAGANHIENCHRSWGFALDGVTHTGGGQIGIVPGVGHGPAIGGASPTVDAGVTTDFVLFDNQIGATTVGTWASGIELNGCSDGVLDGNTVYGVPGFGISLDTTERIVAMGGSIRGCGSYAFRVADNTSKFAVIGVTFRRNTGAATAGAIHLGGTTNHYAVIGCIFEGNNTGGAKNWDVTATGTNRKVIGNVTIDGDLVPEIMSMSSATVWGMQILNDDANGDGLLVAAGTTGSEFILRAMTRQSGADRFWVLGDGTSLHRSAATAGVVSVDVVQGAAGQYKHLLGQRNNATIWALGSNGADDFVVWDSTLLNQNLKVSNGGAVSPRTQLILPAGTAGAPAFVITGTTSGVYSNGGGDLDFAATGVNAHRIRADGLWDTRIAAAAVAAGGGATATLTGAIGGSGPATANFAGWKKEYIGGVASFTPYWR